jgi:hypothetical protein
MAEPAEVLETTTVQRNDAIHFAAFMLENLEFVEDSWRAGHTSHRDPPIHLVTQAVNSLLGLVVFSCEQNYVRFTLKERLADLVAAGWPVWVFELGGSPDTTLGELVYHLRNGAAHARVRFSSDSAIPSEVRITFEDAKTKASPVYWRASISAAELLEFCRRYARHVEDVIG